VYLFLNQNSNSKLKSPDLYDGWFLKIFWLLLRLFKKKKKKKKLKKKKKKKKKNKKNKNKKNKKKKKKKKKKINKNITKMKRHVKISNVSCKSFF